ncbi:relaxase domain-containing protein [Brachybacterium halotolerans subsp. kimchii]|uniref:MobF family relaxase n=1 Tax=Brachybacterium halotolerans TaxID=2795215 RepID=UPI001E5EC050|nr:MobF family relaxase [Brachybacterium halotolerans]UEJ82769.1 relaxase domain-containing protein [Brachybacterium halotolerans subsp. kimchii]
MAMNTTRISSVEYLQNTVAKADMSSSASVAAKGLTAYYTDHGNPPGRWIGAGATAAGIPLGGSIGSNEAIALWQKFRHPETGVVLGKPPRGTSRANHSSDVNQLAESTAQARRDVAGFDLTFTIPKDASILWALSDTSIQSTIAQCHDWAVAETIRQMETRVLQTRAGHGGVAAVGAQGVLAGKWDHWDSRDGDPHLHSHVVISNRVQRASDGKWVTLDSRSLFKSTVALSELHQNLFMDEMHRTLGVEWAERAQVASRAVVPEIVGMDEQVRDMFSTRRNTIRQALAGSVDEFVQKYGRDPSPTERREIKNAAWRATRKAKKEAGDPLPDRCAQWREETSARGHDTAALVAACLHRSNDPDLDQAGLASVTEVLAALTAGSMGDAQETSDTARIARLAASFTDDLTAARSTWSVANVRAEVERTLRLVRTDSPEVRAEAVDLICEAVLSHCIEITPARYRIDTDDPRVALRGRAVFDDINRSVFTSHSALHREQVLLAALTTPGAIASPPPETVDALVDAINDAQRATKGYALAPDQDAAVRAILRDDARMSVLIGPAGTGKTTTMSALRSAWESAHPGTHVVGLTTSAQAAHVLSDEIDAPAHTIAKWLHETTRGNARRAEEITRAHALLARMPHEASAERGRLRRQIARLQAQSATWAMHPGQLIIVDEASMSSTPHLLALTQQAEAAGAKVLAVGDHRQLDAVEAGGALALLAQSDRALELSSVWRFHDDPTASDPKWEAKASLTLRQVRDEDEAADLVSLYSSHERITTGADENMIDQAYTATRDALATGETTAIVIAATNDVVGDLNARFQSDRIEAGQVDVSRATPLRDGFSAGIGDRVLARTNDRTLTDDHGDFIRNGSLMTVTDVGPDGSLIATRDGTDAHVTIPAGYCSASMELGYATTAHRSQGVTVDEARLVLPTTDSVPAELLYVGMTRGRSTNKVYVGEDPDARENAASTSPGHLIATPEAPTALGRLAAMMTTTGAEQSATATLDESREARNTLDHLVAEHEYLVSLAPTTDLLARVCQTHGLDSLEVETSVVAPSLAAAWTTAQALSPRAAEDALTSGLFSREDESDADEALGILTHRLRQVTADGTGPGLLHGITPPLPETTDDEVRGLDALVLDRLASRVRTITQRAARSNWGSDLPDYLRTRVAIYRDLHDVRTQSALGPPPPKWDTRARADYWGLHRELEHRITTPASGSIVPPGLDRRSGPLPTPPRLIPAQERGPRWGPRR